MVRLLNSPLWRQWEFDPPVFTQEDVQGRWKAQLDRFHQVNVLRETTPAGQWWCDECCEPHLITYDQHVDERSGVVVCEGGLLPLRREQTEQLKIDTASLLGMLFAGSRLAVDPIIGQRLWSVGRQGDAGLVGSFSR
jgi:hypothetical protein